MLILKREDSKIIVTNKGKRKEIKWCEDQKRKSQEEKGKSAQIVTSSIYIPCTSMRISTYKSNKK